MFICNLSPKIKPCENHRQQMFPKWEKCQCKETPWNQDAVVCVKCRTRGLGSWHCCEGSALPCSQPPGSSQLWGCSSSVQLEKNLPQTHPVWFPGSPSLPCYLQHAASSPLPFFSSCSYCSAESNHKILTSCRSHTSIKINTWVQTRFVWPSACCQSPQRSLASRFPMVKQNKVWVALNITFALHTFFSHTECHKWIKNLILWVPKAQHSFCWGTFRDKGPVLC